MMRVAGLILAIASVAFVVIRVVWDTVLTFERQSDIALFVQSYRYEMVVDTAGTTNQAFRGFHSQWGQDRWVSEYLSRFAGEDNGQRGIYIELGAYDGLTHSNTAYFEQVAGFDGLCIEPTTVNYERLRTNRPACIKVHAGVHNACPKKEREFVTFRGLETGLSGWVDTYNPHTLRMHEQTKDSFRSRVPCFTMAAILTQHGLADRRIEYLSLDTEGAELPVLRSMGFEAQCQQAVGDCPRRPRVVQVEVRRYFIDGKVADGGALKAEKAVQAYLAGQGYSVQREFTAGWQPPANGTAEKSYDLIFVRDVDRKGQG